MPDRAPTDGNGLIKDYFPGVSVGNIPNDNFCCSVPQGHGPGEIDQMLWPLPANMSLTFIGHLACAAEKEITAR